MTNKVLCGRYSQARPIHSTGDCTDIHLERVLDFWSLYSRHVISRRLLSFAPLYYALSPHLKEIKSICGFGSGSGFMETSLALMNGATAAMFDEKLAINNSTSDFFLKNTKYSYNVCSVESLRDVGLFDLNISVQTLEHIKDWQIALKTIADSVKLGGLVYIDVPFFNNDCSVASLGVDKVKTEHDRQWRIHKHYRCGFTVENIRDALSKLDFEILSCGMSAFHQLDSKIYKHSVSLANCAIDRKEIKALFKKHMAAIEIGNQKYDLDLEQNKSFADKTHDAIYIVAKKGDV